MLITGDAESTIHTNNSNSQSGVANQHAQSHKLFVLM